MRLYYVVAGYLVSFETFPSFVSSVKLELDGREVELPELESIVVLNINRYGFFSLIPEKGVSC